MTICSKFTSHKVKTMGHYPIVRHDKNYEKKIFFRLSAHTYSVNSSYLLEGEFTPSESQIPPQKNTQNTHNIKNA